MEKFTASNGVEILESGFDREERPVMSLMCREREDVIMSERQFPAHHWDALREFFRHERDEELGRWRWPENPDYVVQRVAHEDDGDGRCVMTISESGAYVIRWWEFIIQGGDDIHQEAARAYFAAHPESMPWHDAKRDDVWKFVTKDDTRHALAWRSTDDWDVMTPHGTAITAVDDPVTALVDGGFPEFAMLESAKKLTEATNG